LLLAVPVIVGASVNDINILIDRTVASGIAVGGISALNYAARLNGFVQGLIVVSVTSVMYPMISRMPVDDNLEGLKQTLKDAISIVSLLIIPATIGAMAFSNEIVNLLFGRGAFTVEAINMTGDALFYYSVGMIAYGLRDILSRAFYSLKDTKTPVITATIAVILNIVLNLILSRYIGIGGLALATSISSIVATVSLFFILRRRIGALGIKGLTMSVGKNVLASLIMVL